MVTRSSRPGFSLRAKLVLSYLGVALGAMLLLIIVVTVVVQNYFYSAQLDQLQANAEYYAQYVGQRYQQAGENWNLGPIYGVPELYILVNANDQSLYIAHPGADNTAFQQPLQQALQGQEVQGNLQV